MGEEERAGERGEAEKGPGPREAAPLLGSLAMAHRVLRSAAQPPGLRDAEGLRLILAKRVYRKRKGARGSRQRCGSIEPLTNPRCIGSDRRVRFRIGLVWFGLLLSSTQRPAFIVDISSIKWRHRQELIHNNRNKR